jgi:hypothetical protein
MAQRRGAKDKGRDVKRRAPCPFSKCPAALRRLAVGLRSFVSPEPAGRNSAVQGSCCQRRYVAVAVRIDPRSTFRAADGGRPSALFSTAQCANNKGVPQSCRNACLLSNCNRDNRGVHQMVKAFAFAVVIFAMFGLAVQDAFAADGARWYPFYGYRQPSYLTRPAVAAQPSTATVRTAFYPPEPGSAAPAPTVVPQYSSPAPSSTGGRWYPFYGYRRPNLD